MFWFFSCFRSLSSSRWWLLKLRGKKCLILKELLLRTLPQMGQFVCMQRQLALKKCKSFNAKRGGNTCTNAKASMQKEEVILAQLQKL